MTTLPEQQSKKSLLQQFNETRSRTLELVKTLEKDDFVVQTAFYMSPPKWHLGHVSWMYEVILSKIDKTYEFYSKEFSEYLNSYYQQFGVPQDKGRRGLVSRPTVDQIFEYFQIVNQRTESFLQNATLSAEASKLIVMGFHHECQHQELLVYDLQHLLADQYRPVRKNSLPTPSKIEQKPVKVKGGLYIMGYNGSDYCYDIELPEHKVYLKDYRIDSLPVTNEHYLKFIEDGGYNDYKFWLSDGWEKVKENNWNAQYNDDKNRIEMYLRSLEKQTIRITKANLSLTFEENELIHTEHSYKYSVSKIPKLFGNTGFIINKIWQDENNRYTIVLASKN